MTARMTGREQKAARALMDALGRLEFKACAKSWIRLNPEEFVGRQGPAVLVRHPEAVANGQHLLLAVVGVKDGALVITYCVEVYRMGIQAAIKSAVNLLERGPRNLGEP